MAVKKEQQHYKVYVNVYDILPPKRNQMMQSILCFGIYHTGVEINGSEYAYGGNCLMDSTGVYEMFEPRNHDVFEYRTSLEVGSIPKENSGKVWKVL
jgi:hypothetical protein